MFIRLCKDIGSIVASDQLLSTDKYIKCDGRKVLQNDYPELCGGKDYISMPDYRGLLPHVTFYVIAKA